MASSFCNRSMFNVVMTGICFMLVFTAFQTGAIIEPRVLDAVRNETASSSNPFTGDGYISLSIIYLVFAFANWIAAPIVAVLGSRISMFIGGLIYSGFIASFLAPQTWLLYVMSTLLGLAAAVIWTAQGKYLTLNSNDSTMALNTGIFWALFQSSLLFGNLFVHFEFSGPTIDKHTRLIVYAVLTGTGVLGTLLMIAMRKPMSDRDSNIQSTEESEGAGVSPWRKMLDELKTAFRILLTKDMALLSLTFLYTGFELTFFSGVYSTCISHTGQFGDAANSYIGYSGMLIGIGEIIGGLIFGILGKIARKYGRNLIVLLGFLLHILSFFLIFLNLPDDTPTNVSSAPAYIEPSVALALICSFLLGFADSCYNTQIYSILGVVYSDNSGAAFSLFKFSQSLAAAIGFFYSDYLVLKWQLLILLVTAVVGSFAFFKVEWTSHRRANDYETLETAS